ncbi:hypothetical protein ACIA8C_18355 [Nocardia sp. NPDC051321]|uniref:hypothetical protein n=1 Tax=Nocardia sp. NPDC051321 TaxID=3364323 RepID=UPI0037B18C8F
MEPTLPTSTRVNTHAPQPVSPEQLERLRKNAPGSLPDDLLQWSAAVGAVAPAATIFGKAFLESLAERAADGVAGLPGKLRQRWFRHGRQGSGNNELSAVLDIENGSAAAILVTADLPDEARLALLDLDPTEPAWQGKILGWDFDRQRWAPVEPPTTQVTPPSPA